MFWRLFGAYGLLILASIGVLGALIVSRVEQRYRDQMEDALHIRAVLVRQTIGKAGDNRAALQEEVTALGREIQTRITLIADNGAVVADSEEDAKTMDNHGGRMEVEQARKTGAGSAMRYSRALGQNMMYVALRTQLTDSPVAYVRVALPLDAVQERLSELHWLIWTAAAMTGLAAMVLAFWTARRITASVRGLTEGARQIAAGGYGHRVYAVGGDEISMLADAFNRMSEGLETQIKQLEEDRQQLRTILSGMVEGVIALDAEQRILFANERAAQLLEFAPQATVGRKFWEVVRQRSLQEGVKRALDQPEPYHEELKWNGPVVKSLTVHAARLPGKPPRGVVLVLYDTSELRRLERLRQDFVANVSHELKTPLSVIKACVETLTEGAADDPHHRTRFLEQIADQAERLHALILDLLSLARIESGAEVFEFEAVSLGRAAEACLERHRARAKAKNQALELVAANGAQEKEVAAWADEEAVGQILDNLVDNAVKYTPVGGRIRVSWRAEDGQACLEVNDTGIGIPEQDLPRIFERFYRVDKARSRELGGTGLGLSIVKHLVQAMQGSIVAKSRPGQGTCFSIRLPRAEGS